MATTVVTPAGEGPAQAGAEGSEGTPAAPAGSGAVAGATLESRIAGLEARLAEQGRGKSAAEKERDAANARLAEYEQGKLTDNEAFQAELARERARADAAEQTAKIASLAVKYPESFAVFGDSIVHNTEEALAAAEARFKGAEAPVEPPTPRSPAAPRPAAAKPGEAGEGRERKTYAQLRDEFVRTRAPWQDE